MVTTLKKGSKGAEVKLLQELLCKAGYAVAIDSDFGNKTHNAVVAFQKSKSLVADGIVGSKTWAALTGANSATVVDPSVVYLPLSVHITKCPGRAIKYLAIHYTAGSGSGKGRARAVKNVFESRKASADFAVDDFECVQFNPDPSNYYCWAVGDPKQAGATVIDGNNKNTISIEICSTLTAGTYAVPNHDGWKLTDAAVANAVKLAKILMRKYNIPLERVVRHYDISGKLCPGVVGWNGGRLYTQEGKVAIQKNNSAKWNEFKRRLQ